MEMTVFLSLDLLSYSKQTRLMSIFLFQKKNIELKSTFDETVPF